MIIEIRYVSQLPLEKLQDILDKGINVEGISITSEIDHVVRYSVDDYKKIYRKLEELIDGINPSWSRAKKFVMIYKRMTENIEYDHIAADPKSINIIEQRYSKREKTNCRSLKNGLLYSKCVCQGYSEIMRNACSLLGIIAVEVVDERHSWNQILIDYGKWIEIDATWGCRDQVKYIGCNKEAFWQEHGREYNSIFEEENDVVNFDLAGFINTEFGINVSWYTKEEEKQFIGLIEKRDIYKQDINEELNILMPEIYRREEFEKECGYTIRSLLEQGFTEDMIEIMQHEFDEHTGIRINRKELVENMVQEKKQKIQQFEQKCGHTLEELRELGFNEKEIEALQYNYSPITGKKVESSKIIDRRIELMKTSDDKLSMYGKTERIRYLANDLHPETVKKINQFMIDGKITFEEAYEIVKYKHRKGRVEDIEKVQENMQKRIQEKEEQEFERECGYTIEKLIELGFSEAEIKELQGKYDSKLGIKLNRRKRVEMRVRQKQRQKNATLEENKKINNRIKEYITEEKYGQFTPLVQDYLNRALNEYNLSPEFIDIFVNSCKTIKIGKIPKGQENVLGVWVASEKSIIINNSVAKIARKEQKDSTYENLSYTLNNEIMHALFQDIPDVGKALTEAITEVASFRTSFGKDRKKMENYKDETLGYGNITFGVNILSAAMGISEKQLLQLAFEHKINEALEQQMGSKDTAYMYLHEINRDLERIRRATYEEKHTKQELDFIKTEVYHSLYIRRKRNSKFATCKFENK